MAKTMTLLIALVKMHLIQMHLFLTEPLTQGFDIGLFSRPKKMHTVVRRFLLPC